jgi:hypothetical protein
MSVEVGAGRPYFGGQLTKVRTPGNFGRLLHPRGSAAPSTNGQFKPRYSRGRAMEAEPE